MAVAKVCSLVHFSVHILSLSGPLLDPFIAGANVFINGGYKYIYSLAA